LGCSYIEFDSQITAGEVGNASNNVWYYYDGSVYKECQGDHDEYTANPH